MLPPQLILTIADSHHFAMFSSKSNTHPQHRKSKPSGKRCSGPKLAASSPKFRPAASSYPAPTRPACQICGKFSHQALDCFHRMDHAFQGRHPPAQLSAMVADSNSAPANEPWYADSAANQHITANLKNLSLQQPYLCFEDVAVGVLWFFTLLNPHFISLKYYNVPKLMLTCSQSINQFCLDNNCFFILTGSQYFVKDNRTGLTLLEGRSEDGLYPIQLKSFYVNNKHALTTLLGVKTSAAVWHSRLGHASQPIVSQVLQQFSLPVSGVKQLNGICEPCQLDKSKQLPFQSSPRVSMCPLDLIHSDVWSCSTKSLGGCYYVLFIDDFSIFTWLYPIHHKSDVFSVFVQFKSLVENQFSTSIKQFQCDGGGEYMSTQFKNFLIHHGILHRISCPHTPQQNGVAERKHRHIMEMCLSLLAQSHLSSLFWVDVFATSVFIINRLPSSTIDNVSPYFKHFNKEPDYSLFCSFGCSCFPLLRPYSTH